MNNSLIGTSFVKPKRQKTVEHNNYLSHSEKENSPVKFKFGTNKSPRVSAFFSPNTLMDLA